MMGFNFDIYFVFEKVTVAAIAYFYRKRDGFRNLGGESVRGAPETEPW